MSDKKWASIGLPFQISMCSVYLVSLYLYMDGMQHLGYYAAIDFVGWGLFGVVLATLYPIGRERPNRLITNGVFRYTRHPMYTGLLLMSGAFWFSEAANDALFYALQAVCIISLLIAAWCQEKETLARYGDEAVRYYARTPRLFFMYPLTLLRTQ